MTQTPELPAQWHADETLVSGLYIVSVPIGNSLDITLRALKVLMNVDAILCEDTRVARKLLNTYGISKKLISYFDENEAARVPKILAELQQGARLALISDAGTPLIADPGYRLVVACRAADIKVIPVPGVSAIVCALSVAGLPSHGFAFGGFLPSKKTQRRKQLEQIIKSPLTQIFYEAPHRIFETIEDLRDVLGNRSVVITRELTKTYEHVIEGTPEQIMARYPHDAECWRGEMVLLIAPYEDLGHEKIDIETRLKVFLQECTLKEAVALVVEETGARRSEVYRVALSLTAEDR